MKLQVCCICAILFIGNMAFASAIIDRPLSHSQSNIRQSNIVKSSISNNSNLDMEAIELAIKELKTKIKNNPNDYSLNAALVNLYLNAKQYENSYYELIYLNNLNTRNKLNLETKKTLNDIYNNLKTQVNYNPKKSSIFLNLSILALIMNDYDKAEKYISAAANSNYDRKLIQNAITKVFDETRNYQTAIGICDKLLAIKPSDSETRKLKASYLLQIKDTDGAIKEYTMISENNSSDYKSKYELYKLLISKNLSEKDIIKQMYALKSLDEALIDLGNMLFQNNDLNDALKYANLLVNKFPENAQGYILLTEIYKKQGKLQEAYDALAKVRDKADNNEAIAKYNVLLAKLSDEPLKEANSLMETGLYSQALSVLQSADQENLYVILAQARANYFLNQKQQALQYLNKAMSLYPNNSDVFCAFGYIYYQEKDIDSAKKYVQNSLKINPENKTAKDLMKLVNKLEADKYVNGIISSFESQNYSETMKLIDKAIEISPDYGLLYYYKGLTYIAQNNYAASTAALYKCLELDKTNITTYFYLAIAFDNLSEKNNALMYYQKFINLLPKDDYGESEKLEYAKDRIAKLKS